MDDKTVEEAIANFRKFDEKITLGDLKKFFDPDFLLFCTIPSDIYEMDKTFFNNSIDLFLQERVYKTKIYPLCTLDNDGKRYFCLISSKLIPENKRYCELFGKK